MLWRAGAPRPDGGVPRSWRVPAQPQPGATDRGVLRGLGRGDLLKSAVPAHRGRVRHRALGVTGAYGRDKPGRTADNGRVSIQGQVALVTGASSGIGRATAQLLAAQGVRVIVHGRDQRALTELASRIHGVPVFADLSEPTGAQQLAERALAATGRIDILVANAGVGWAGPFGEMVAGDIDRLIAVNLTAPVRLTQALLPAMAERRSGYLAFVTSIAGRTGVAGEAVDAATKAGPDASDENLRLALP